LDEQLLNIEKAEKELETHLQKLDEEMTKKTLMLQKIIE